MGYVYVTGTTSSIDFPATVGAFQTGNQGGEDAYVTKLNPNAYGAASLVYSTYLGGIGDEEGLGLAVDSSHSAYATGVTQSANFPWTAGSYQSPSSGGQDAFLVKVNPAGSLLTYSARLSGSGDDAGWGVAVDSQGNAYVAGQTSSLDFPVTPGAYQTAAHSVNNQAFVSKLNPTGSSLIYSTYLGGSGADIPFGMALDSGGDVYLTGITSSTDFPTTAGALSTSLSGASDGFVSQLNGTGASLLYSTYLGGSGVDQGDQIALDPNGGAYITGYASSSNFPVGPGSFQTTLRGAADAFIVKMNFGTPPTPPVLSIVSGNNQSAPAGTALPNPLMVLVTQNGIPVAGVTVTFSPANATVNPSTALTDASGHAQTTVTLGATVGAAIVNVSVTGATTVVFTATVQAPGPGSIAVTSAASYAVPPVAPSMIAVIWWVSGSDFTTASLTATSVPLPTSLGGVSVTIQDSSGAQTPMPLFYVFPRQLCVEIPSTTQGGTATITVTGSDGLQHSGTLTIASVAPGLFSATANGQGYAVGQAWNVKANGTATITGLCCTTNAQGQQAGIPIDMGAATDTTLVVLYGTGLRGLTSLANASATAGGQTAVVDYAGAQGSFVGLDQVNLTLPQSLRGQGTVPISLTLDGKTA
ncbi:MAG: SBBP repeat-containing protein, partial [Bryobacteraceae bacterium]